MTAIVRHLFRWPSDRPAHYRGKRRVNAWTRSTRGSRGSR